MHPAWSLIERPNFTRSYDDPAAPPRVTVDRFPPVIAVTDDLLAPENAPYVQHGDGIVTFRVDNGTASYGLVEHDPMLRIWLALKGPDTPAP